jgi:ATP phosphoribosyltransferase regulatory subunit
MSYLSPPPGFRDYLPNEVENIRNVEKALRTVCESFGYREVITPTLEYADIISIGTNLKDETVFYRVIDKDGALLSMRPEFTTSIARVAATRFKEINVPLRFYYIGKVFRNISSQPLVQKEFTQGGIELIGDESIAGDIEVVSIIEEIFKALNLPIHIEIGHARILLSIIKATGTFIIDYIKKGDFVTIKDFIKDKNILEFVEAIPFLSGGKEVLEEAYKFIKYLPDLELPLNQLSSFISHLEELGYNMTKINLGMVRDFEYYTGITIEGYLEDLGLPVVGGGRYNGLLEKFGLPLPATGFAIGIERVASKIESKESIPDIVIGYSNGRFKEAMKLAQKERENGSKVEIFYCPNKEILNSLKGKKKVFLC